MLFLLSERAGLTGSAWGDWALYADSPLRASTQEVLFKGGAGSVDGGSGFSSAPAASSASASVSTTLGVQAPVGYWDPLGLNKNADTATFNRRRAVEIKHGRVAMYATMGYIVPEYYKFPGGELRELCKSRALALRTSGDIGGHAERCLFYLACPIGYLSPSLGLKFSDVPSGLAAISKVPVLASAVGALSLVFECRGSSFQMVRKCRVLSRLQGARLAADSVVHWPH